MKLPLRIVLFVIGCWLLSYGSAMVLFVPGVRIILDDFAYAAGVGILFDYERFNLREPAGIADFLYTAATLVHKYGDPLLKGEVEAFREFRNSADERERSYIEMMERQHSAQG